ncbi:integrin beta-1-like [Amphiura filiformis]|uniref:integrin beta-1-like n=1 Tax=Amphiura filiformis TaxID=82378 RepID=UPI003B225948
MLTDIGRYWLYARILIIHTVFMCYAQENGFSDVGLCSQADSCDQCMIQHPSCAWCKYPEFDKSENFARCNTVDNLRQDGCIEQMIHFPQSQQRVNKNAALNANSDLGRIVQVAPQKVTLHMRPGEPLRIPLNIRQSEDFPVDLYVVMDVTYTMKNDLDNLKILGAVIVQKMGEITKDFRLGFGAFVEKLTLPYVEIIDKRFQDPCAAEDLVCEPPFGFRNIVPLTSNTTKFSVEISKVQPSANLDDMEGGMDALMQATVCTDQIGWRKHARHLLLYATDDSFHTAGDGLLGGIVTRNDGKCHLDDIGEYTESLSMDYPSISQLSAAMKTHSVLPIFAIGPLTRRDMKKNKKKPDPVIYYQDLPQFFHEALTARLSEDSSNIVELVQEIYKNITSAVKIEDDAPADAFDIDYSADCGNGMQPGVSECSGIQISEDVAFQIEITLNQSACRGYNGHTYKFGIGPTSFLEELTVLVHPICDCPCSNTELRGSKICNGTGERVCGACICDEGWSGVRCDCDREEAEGQDQACIWKNSTDEIKECNGRGSCICGGCRCNKPGSGKQIYGTHCQCDNFSCPRYGNQVCGGTKRGSCLCNQTTGEHYCNCTDGYTGESCNCTRSLESCMSPKGVLCSGVGECVCGRCICNDTDKYGGATCQNCRGCPGECELNAPCVQCKAFQSGEFYSADPQCSQCPYPVHIVDELSKRPGSQDCIFQDVDDCSFIFSYERLKNGSYYLEVQATKICPRPPDVLWVIIGIIVGIILVGLALLFIWRVLTNIHDRREFQQFEKERASARWQTGENPIYKPSTTVFKNPTYGK